MERGGALGTENLLGTYIPEHESCVSEVVTPVPHQTGDWDGKSEQVVETSPLLRLLTLRGAWTILFHRVQPSFSLSYPSLIETQDENPDGDTLEPILGGES